MYTRMYIIYAYVHTCIFRARGLRRVRPAGRRLLPGGPEGWRPGPRFFVCSGAVSLFEGRRANSLAIGKRRPRQIGTSGGRREGLTTASASIRTRDLERPLGALPPFLKPCRIETLEGSLACGRRERGNHGEAISRTLESNEAVQVLSAHSSRRLLRPPKLPVMTVGFHNT